MTMKERMEKIMQKVAQPSKLTEAEKAQFVEAFDNIKGVIEMAKEDVLKMDREDAHAYLDKLTAKLEEVDQGDPVGPQVILNDDGPEEVGVSPVEEGVVRMSPVPRKKTFLVKGELHEAVSLEPPTAPIRQGSNVPVKRVTAEEFKKWFDALPAQGKDIARRKLDCVKNFFDEKSPDKTGPICVECSPQALSQCVRNEDPSYHDAHTDFLSAQLGRENE